MASTIGKSKQLATKLVKYYDKYGEDGAFDYPDYADVPESWSDEFSGEFVDYIQEGWGKMSVEEWTDYIKAYYRNSWED